MIIIKSAKEIEKMRQAGRVAAQAMEKVLAAVRPGVTTGELDRIAFDYIIGRERRHPSKDTADFPALSVHLSMSKLCMASRGIGACGKGIF